MERMTCQKKHLFTSIEDPRKKLAKVAADIARVVKNIEVKVVPAKE
jgi:hypothetical protein